MNEVVSTARPNEPRSKQMLDMMDGRLVTAAEIAGHLGVSERTVYRYVGRLRSAGHKINSGAGAGYLLRSRKTKEAPQ